MSDTTFYRAFEERHRGSRELIKGRLRVYLPFILPLRQIYDDCPALDLGCGRGEWLELASEAGFNAHGVDLDDGMLEACYERGLSVEKQDAIKALKALPDESQVAVSAFHLVEHIPFDAVQTLVKEALRVLKPAGLLIMETPNPENILVGTTNFYLDPTHQRPIPPQLLSFLPEHCGFSRTKILRLQEVPGLVKKEDLNIFDIIGGVSPDYAVVAQKDADKENLALFDDAFKKEYGLTIDNLAMRYDSSKSKIHQLETALAVERERSSHVQAQLEQLIRERDAATEAIHQLEAELSAEREKTKLLSRQENTIQQYENDLNSARMKIDELNGQTHHWWTVADSLNKELQGVYASWSWRLTYPLRQLNLYRRKFCAGVKEVLVSMLSLPRRLVRRILEVGLMYVRRHPAQKARLKVLLSRRPRLQARLYAFAAARHASAQVAVSMPPVSAPAGSIDLSSYPVSARTIYRQLLVCRSQSCHKEESA